MKNNAPCQRMPALILLFAMGALLFSGCGEGAYTPDSLTVALSEPFEGNFNYYEAEGKSDRTVIELVAGTPLRESANGGWEPYLGDMQAQTSDGRLTVTLTLKKNIKFSDGKKVTIDDLIFQYTLLADPGYTGVYADFWKSPIEGLAAYYWDDPSGEGEVPDFEAQARESYSPDKIREEDLKTYLRETSLAGEYPGNPTDVRSDGATWAEYITEQGFGEELEKVMSSSAGVLELLVNIYYDNFADRYDATEWYARRMRREYMSAVTSDGVDVSDISGITRVDDYTCRVTFTDPKADYVEVLNRPILSSTNFHFNGKGGGDRAISAYMRTPLIGAGPYSFEKWENNTVTLQKNRYFALGSPACETVRFRFAKGDLIPLNCSLRQFACGFYAAGNADADESARIAALAEQYGMECAMLRDGVFVYDPVGADFTPLLPQDGEKIGAAGVFAELWRVTAAKV